MKLNFTVGMGRDMRIDEVASHARVAEESGFSHMSFVDLQNLSRDVYVMMTIAALNTHRIQIGQGVTIPTRHPSVTANATASIDELSGGRAFLGLGVGLSGRLSMQTKPGSMREFRETVEFIRKYMAGEEAEWNGARMHSEWVRRQVPVYMGCTGPKSLQLAGEIADGVVFSGVHPVVVKWKMEQIEKGALKAGRDPSEIDVWVSAMVYVAGSKEEARQEVASYASSHTHSNYNSQFKRETPESIDLKQRLERGEPGLLDEMRRLADAYDVYYKERRDAPHAKLATQRLVDYYMLTGPVDDICERIYDLQKVGMKTLRLGTDSARDKKGMMREVGDNIMHNFRN